MDLTRATSRLVDLSWPQLTGPFAVILDALDEAVLVLDAQGAVVLQNLRLAELLGSHCAGAATLAQLLAPLDVRGPDGTAARAPHPGTQAPARFTDGVFQVTRPDGRHVWLHSRVQPIHEAGEPSGTIHLLRDVTDQQELRQELGRLKWRSPVTGLPNREHFNQLAHSLPHTSGRTVMLVQCLSITDLRAVSPGVAVQFTQAFAEVLERAYADALLVGQLDERTFALVLPALDVNLREAALAPVTLGTEVIYPRVRACARTWPDDQPVGTAVQAAESSFEMTSEGTLLRTEDHHVQTRRRRVQLEHALRRALDGDELQVEYQPIVRLATGELVKAEALVRWHDAEVGTVSPEQFVPLAEALGQAQVLTDLVIRRALAEARRASHLLNRDVRIAVNLAPREMNAENFMDRMYSLVTDHPDAPRRLAFEVTERGALNNLERTARHLRTLRAWGFGLALDDFGTGHSALSVLQHLPIHHLKLDRSFLWGIEDDDRLRTLTGSVMALASRLNIEVVAESVETAGHEAILRDLGCPLGQGFLYGRPQPFPDWGVYQ